MLLAYVPCASAEEAKKIGKALVKQKLVACANVVPSVHSIFWWKGRLEESAEALLLCKTLDKNADAVEKFVRTMHSYDVPCIFFCPAARVNEDYLRWLEGVVR